MPSKDSKDTRSKANADAAPQSKADVASPAPKTVPDELALNVAPIASECIAVWMTPGQLALIAHIASQANLSVAATLLDCTITHISWVNDEVMRQQSHENQDKNGSGPETTAAATSVH